MRRSRDRAASGVEAREGRFELGDRGLDLGALAAQQFELLGDLAAAELQACMAIATVVSVMSCLKLEIMMDSLVGMGLAVATHKSRDSVVSCFSSRETAD